MHKRIWDNFYAQQDLNLERRLNGRDPKDVFRNDLQKLQQLRSLEHNLKTARDSGWNDVTDTLNEAINAKLQNKEFNDGELKIATEKVGNRLWDKFYSKQDQSLKARLNGSDPRDVYKDDPYKLQQLRHLEFNLEFAQRRGWNDSAKTFNDAISAKLQNKEINANELAQAANRVSTNIWDGFYSREDRNLQQLLGRDPRDVFGNDREVLEWFRHMQYQSNTAKEWGWNKESGLLEEAIRRQLFRPVAKSDSNKDLIAARMFGREQQNSNNDHNSNQVDPGTNDVLVFSSLWS
jgi:hypothetical protein